MTLVKQVSHVHEHN